MRTSIIFSGPEETVSLLMLESIIKISYEENLDLDIDPQVWAAGTLSRVTYYNWS